MNVQLQHQIDSYARNLLHRHSIILHEIVLRLLVIFKIETGVGKKNIIY